MVEHDVDKGRDGKNVGNGGESRALSERVTGGSRIVLDKTLGAHSIEGSLLGDNESDLSRLGGEEETSGMTKVYR